MFGGFEPVFIRVPLSIAMANYLKQSVFVRLTWISFNAM